MLSLELGQDLCSRSFLFFVCATDFLTEISQIYSRNEQPMREVTLRAFTDLEMESTIFTKKWCIVWSCLIPCN